MTALRAKLLVIAGGLGFLTLALVFIFGGDLSIDLKQKTLSVHGRAQEQMGHLVQLETRVSRLEEAVKNAR